MTNQISYLNQTDHVVFMSEGEIIEQGPYKNLIESGGCFYNYVKQSIQNSQNLKKENPSGKEINEYLCSKTRDEGLMDGLSLNKKGILIEDEGLSTGNISFYILKDFFNKFGNLMFFIYLIALAIEHTLQAIGIVWLSDWIEESKKNPAIANKDAIFRLGKVHYR